MSQQEGILILGAICAVVLFVAVLKKRAQIILNFLVRMVLGAICMIFLNDLFGQQNLYINVGLNPVTLLTSGALGFPGVALLYGISAAKFL